MALSTNIYAEVITTFPASVVGSGGITVTKSGGVYTITFSGANIGINTIGLDKIEQIASDRLLGRDTDATGDVEQLTVGGGIEFTGSGGIQSSAHTGDVTKAAGGVATTIANDAVTTVKILDANVTTPKIADGNVTAAKLATDSVETAKIVDANVTTAKVADNAITLAKMATQATLTILANITGGLAVPVASTLTAIIDACIGSTRGAILYRGASVWSILAPGTSGHFLKSNGAGADPSYATATATVADGTPIQTIEATPYTAVTSLSTNIPFDDTVPQNTEGDQILTATITPSATTSKIRAKFSGTISHATSGTAVAAALFKDSDASAQKSDFQIIPGNGYMQNLTIVHTDSPATTSPVTYKIRAGSQSGSAAMNGQVGSRIGGGTQGATLVLEEIKGS